MPNMCPFEKKEKEVFLDYQLFFQEQKKMSKEQLLFSFLCVVKQKKMGCTKQRNPGQSSAIPAQSSAIQRNLEKNIYFPSQNMILQIRQKFLNRF